MNQACRNMASRGLLVRRHRADGRIGNYPTGPKFPTAPSPLKAHSEPLSPGDSAEQRETEVLLVNLLAEKLGVRLVKKRIDLPGGGWLEVDGASDSPPIICEAWAHVGTAKVAQKHSTCADEVEWRRPSARATSRSRSLTFRRTLATGYVKRNGANSAEWLTSCGC